MNSNQGSSPYQPPAGVESSVEGSAAGDDTSEQQSRRPLDLTSTTTIVAASMIGAGVYTTSGYTLAALGSPERVVAAWLVGGLIAICGAIGYGALAARLPESGGEYLFLSKTLHPVAGLMAGWVSLLAGFTGAIAIAAMGLEKYLAPMVSSSLPGGSVATVAVLVAAVMHTVGVRMAARIQDVVVLMKLIMIAAFIVISILTIGSWQGFAESSGVGATEVAPFQLLDFTKQLVWISFSYAGFNAAVYVAAEVTEAKRTVPRAMVLATSLVTAVYIALNAVFVFAPPAAMVTDEANISQVAATAAMSIGGSHFAAFVRIVIVVSLFTSVSALVMTGPRVYARMAEDGFFPSLFRFVDRPPVFAIWFQAILAIIAISMTTLQELLGYLGLTLSVCSALTVSMLFVLRWRGDLVRLPLGGVPAGIYVSATLVLAVLYAVQEPRQALATAVTVSVGILLYPWIKRSRVESMPGD